jgi:hypothetical protein
MNEAILNQCKHICLHDGGYDPFKRCQIQSFNWMFLLINEKAHQEIHYNTCSCLKKERILKWMKEIKLIAHA